MSMKRLVRVAATQMSCCLDIQQNIVEAERLVRDAAAKGAKIILLQELFKTLYFCQEQKPKYFDWADEEQNSQFLNKFSNLSKELGVVLPISFFERFNNTFYNSLVVFDADGQSLGKYRKNHIPDGPGYMEKFYFSPGDLGFPVFKTSYGTIGIGICWDQWFPETARSLALQGAEIIFYPTAIGSEPENPGYNSQPHWERAMVGHSASNMVPVVASNRIGTEVFDRSQITFYGSSFITNHTGEILTKASKDISEVIIADLDLDLSQQERRAWGLFRDRRPSVYNVLLTKDGVNQF